MDKTYFTLSELKKKAEHFCAYQERCHQEVEQKLNELRATPDEKSLILVHLIEQNFLNEERFAQSFARGKHSIKKYGKARIFRELKLRGLSDYNIKKALEEIPNEVYSNTFQDISEKTWFSLTEQNTFKKKKKFYDTLIRKGYEIELITQAWEQFHQQ